MLVLKQTKNATLNMCRMFLTEKIVEHELKAENQEFWIAGQNSKLSFVNFH